MEGGSTELEPMIRSRIFETLKSTIVSDKDGILDTNEVSLQLRRSNFLTVRWLDELIEEKDQAENRGSSASSG